MITLIPLLLPALLLALPAQKPITWTDLLHTRTTWDGAPIRFPATAKPEVQARLMELAPGASNGWHQHPANAYVYILQGEFRVELEDGTTRAFQAGDAYAQVVATWHRGSNPGKTPLRAVIFFLGEAGAPLTLMRPATAISRKESTWQPDLVLRQKKTAERSKKNASPWNAHPVPGVQGC